MIAAITTDPCSRSKSSPSIETATGLRGVTAPPPRVALARAPAARARLDAGGRIARGERLRDRFVVAVSVVDAEASRGTRRTPASPRATARGPAVAAARRATARRPRGRARPPASTPARGAGSCQKRVLPAVRLDERDVPLVASGQPQVLERLVVDREEAARRAVLGRHVPDRRAVGEREPREPGAEVLDELARRRRSRAAICVTVRTRSVAVAPSGSAPLSLNPTTCGMSIEIGSPSIAASASMPPTPQPSTPSPLTIVVCESVPTSVSGNACPSRALDTRARNSRLTWWTMPVFGRHDLEVVERLLAPAQERVALAVALELELRVAEDRARRSRTRPPARSGRSRARPGSSGLIRDGSPPRSAMAFRIAARSTTAGTPVKSCRSTRAGRNEISSAGSACGSQRASASASASSPCRAAFSSRIRSV